MRCSVICIAAQVFFALIGLLAVWTINVLLLNALMYGVEKQTLRWQRAVVFWGIISASLTPKSSAHAFALCMLVLSSACCMSIDGFVLFYSCLRPVVIGPRTPGAPLLHAFHDAQPGHQHLDAPSEHREGGDELNKTVHWGRCLHPAQDASAGAAVGAAGAANIVACVSHP